MKKHLRGMSLIDVVIGAALFLIVFLALMTLLRTSVLLSTFTKAKTGADSILAEQMEYVRSLSYDAVGTIGGTPEGILSGTATTTLNGIPYTVRTSVVYADDAGDGTGGSDSNHLTADYKIVEIAVDYEAHGAHTEKVVGTIAPLHGETTVAGGTLLIHVADADGDSVSGALVHITNATVTPHVDESGFTNTKGNATFAGLLSGTGYQVSVSETGYSDAQTYARTVQNPNPSQGYLTVSEGQTTKATFSIDQLATLHIQAIALDTTPLTNVSFSITGARTYGSSSTGAPLITTDEDITTNGLGEATMSLPWDIYQIVPSGYTVASSSAPLPLQLDPAANTTLILTLTP